MSQVVSVGARKAELAEGPERAAPGSRAAAVDGAQSLLVQAASWEKDIKWEKATSYSCLFLLLGRQGPGVADASQAPAGPFLLPLVVSGTGGSQQEASSLELIKTRNCVTFENPSWVQ
jgi:hypothetical protein